MKIAIILFTLFTAVTAVCQTAPQTAAPSVTLRNGTTCTLLDDAPVPKTVSDIKLDNLKCNKHGGVVANLYLIDGTGPEGFGVKGSHVLTRGGNKRFGNAWGNAFTARLTAGPHTLKSGYAALVTNGMNVGGFGRALVVTPSFGSVFSAPLDLTFAAEADHTYTINAVVWVRNGQWDWTPIVFDATDKANPRIVPNQTVVPLTGEAKSK
jgi:hypothetical protein